MQGGHKMKSVVGYLLIFCANLYAPFGILNLLYSLFNQPIDLAICVLISILYWSFILGVLLVNSEKEKNNA